MGKKGRKNNRLKAVQIKPRNIVLPIIGNIFLFFIISLIISAVSGVFISYVCYLKAGSAGHDFNEMVVSYETSGIDSLSEDDADMFILDPSGQEVFCIGENTCDTTDRVSLAVDVYGYDFNIINYGFDLYADKSDSMLEFDDNGITSIKINHIFDGDESSFEDPDNPTVNIPLWFSTELKDGNRMFMKVNIVITIIDLMFFVFLGLLAAVIVLGAFIIILVSIIRGAVRQNRLVYLLFEDPISHNHNWLWFMSKAGKILSKRMNARNSYAVVSLSFVNYRNFVLCHSMEEGEELLARIYDVLSETVGKGELVAHSTLSHFPMLLKYTDRNVLETRLNDIIAALEIVGSANHKINYQAGVDFVGIDELTGERDTSNRQADIEVEYNNASAARLLLENAGNSSGIQFFGKDIVEQQKWIDRVCELQKKAVVNEEFVVYYQPKYDPRTNKMKGAEALIRWDSPELGFVSPGKFIDIFERTGFIREIDHYMLTHVAEDQKRWLDMGLPCVPVSVNVSRVHFADEDLAYQINSIVTKAGCPTNLIEIELTESAFFEDKALMIKTIMKLQEFGFEVSMDDFGSGYSSLNSLKDLPLNVLKLDAGFFRDAQEDGRGQVVVSEAIRLAKSLNMRTVAEGVEVKDQVNFLASEGCDMIQGYYFAKPMSGSEFEERMKE